MPTAPRRSKIFNQLLWFVLPFVILAVGLTSAVLMWSGYASFKQTIHQDYDNIVKTFASEINLYMQNARTDIIGLTWILRTARLDDWRTELVLAAFQQSKPKFADLVLVTSDGRRIPATDGDASPSKPRDGVVARALAGEAAVSQVVIGPADLPLVFLAAPVQRLGKVHAVVCATLNLKSVWDVLEGIVIGDTGQVAVLDSTGHYIGHPEIDRVVTRTAAQQAQRLEAIRRSIEPVSWIEKRTGISYQCWGAYVPDQDWVVVLSQAVPEIYAHMRANFIWAVLITIAIGGFCIGFGWVRVKKFLRPIHAMHRQVRRIGAGNWDQAVSVTATNEIGELGIAFNEMIAALKKMVRREIEMAEELAHAKNLAVLGITASKVTHEVGNLLNNVDICAHVLKRDTRHGNGQKALANLERESARVKVFIQDFLKFAKPPKVNPVPMALYPIIREVLAMHKPAAETRSIEMELDWPAETPEVLADTQLIYQLFNNLIKNSTEAVDGDGHIRVSAARNNDFLRVTVADDGAGIAPGHVQRIFQPFFTTKGNAGNGLGMAIVKSIVTAHRGTIQCSSQLGKGTQMVVDLPVG